MVELDGILAAAWSPDDGHCSPESVVLGYAMAPVVPVPGSSRTVR